MSRGCLERDCVYWDLEHECCDIDPDDVEFWEEYCPMIQDEEECADAEG